VFVTVAGRTTSIQEAYDILVNLTILIYFVPYLYLFAALVRLRRQAPAADEGIRIPGGAAGLWLIAATGFGATAIALALTLVPPPGANALTYEANLLVQAAIMLGSGIAFYRWGAARARARRGAPAARR
jgi:amino acid transporter